MNPRSGTTLLLLLLFAPAVLAQEPNTAYDFWISKELMHDLLSQKSVLYSVDVDLNAHSGMHALGPSSSDDCEMHLAGHTKKPTLLDPNGVVVEPPYVCENAPPDAGSLGKYFDESILPHGVDCRATGFPRILDEHLTGSETASNPHHFFEIHPVTELKCGTTAVSFGSFMEYHNGSGELSTKSASSCFDMTVEVRYKAAATGNKPPARYEFRVTRPKSCGNFFSFEMSIFSEWIRSVDGSDPTERNGHSAIARVKPGDSNEFKTIKVYTLPGMKEDQDMKAWAEEWRKYKTGTSASAVSHHGVYFYGLSTIDFYSVAKAIRNVNREYTYPKQWTAVPYPLAMVVYGSKQDPNPEANEGENP